MIDSAIITLDSRQRITGISIFVLCIFLAVYQGKEFFIIANILISIFYLATILYKFLLVSIGFVKKREICISQTEIENLSDDTLPVYTILLPVFKETEIIPQLISSISQIDYPQDKLDVQILVEEIDTTMQDALKKMRIPEYFKITIIPDTQPRTKPKACNVGLEKAKGEYLVIYDAEDIPEPDQLKKSICAFRKIEDSRVICLQAKLNYYNPKQNILTRWFTSEYSMWFDLYLPGLDALEVPIPLGGTSNHFKTGCLKEIGGWDPYNVAEDCDLGIRLFRKGFRTRILDSTTWEEANSKLVNWLKQRSRWVKGYIQTWCVHMRKPMVVIKEMGLVNFFSFQLTVAGLFITLLFNPVYWVITAAWVITAENQIFYGFLYPSSDIITYVLLVSNGIFVLLNVMGCLKRSYRYLIPETLISPIYWILMSIGAWKGFLQIFRKPHFWEKTKHGLFVSKNK
ncbi:MAG TPA: glycosyltransferase [Candidatus Ratteibacteria bacterium]|nr:glycosyltransferase [bacterium]HRS06289.1 glycosyltransferase [Candidatus Ratteibacteria bacterium]HON05212.1 glycosyltransferase [bacterium]HOQ81798.1 glycosyltransferase [bacterium]HPC28693.1 glycosyltransferase [bacterium]